MGADGCEKPPAIYLDIGRNIDFLHAAAQFASPAAPLAGAGFGVTIVAVHVAAVEKASVPAVGAAGIFPAGQESS